MRLTVHQIASDGLHFAELYFGEGANIAVDPAKAIDYIRVPDLGAGQTRTWTRGTGPVGLRNEPLSLRWTQLTETSHKIIIEYTEER